MHPLLELGIMFILFMCYFTTAELDFSKVVHSTWLIQLTFRCIGQVFVSFQYDIMVRSFLTHLGMKLLILFLFNLLLLDLKVYLSNCNHQYYSCIEYAELRHYGWCCHFAYLYNLLYNSFLGGNP